MLALANQEQRMSEMLERIARAISEVAGKLDAMDIDGLGWY